jgi:hypothetical protein
MGEKTVSSSTFVTYVGNFLMQGCTKVQRMVLIKWENYGVFLSLHLRQETS